MIDQVPESYDGLYSTLAEAEARAAELQADGRETKIADSLYHFQWVVYATEVSE